MFKLTSLHDERLVNNYLVNIMDHYQSKNSNGTSCNCGGVASSIDCSTKQVFASPELGSIKSHSKFAVL